MSLSAKTPTRAALATLTLFALALGGCGDRPAALDRPISTSGPIVVGRHLAYLDATRERVVFVSPLDAEVRHVEVGRRPSFMIPTPDQGRLVVLCKGWVATTRDEVDQEPNLRLVDPVTGESEVHELGSPFDEVALSDDNRYAVAFFSANAAPDETEALRNPNAVAILDLETGELADKTVRSFGGVPLGVLFSPSIMAPLLPDGSPGQSRTLGVVFAAGSVTLLDVTHPERREVTVRLGLPGMASSITPAQVVFAPEAGALYLTAQGTSDVYVLTLTARDSSDPLENDYVVSINTLAAGTFPADVALFADQGQAKVLVANQQSSDLTVIDAATAQFVSIAVGDPVDRILLYPEESPEVALLFSQGSPGRNIHFLELGDVEDGLGRNLTTLQGAQPVLGMELIPGQPKALVVHDDSRSVLSVLDLEERTLSPFTGHEVLSGYAVTADGRIFGGFTAGRDQLGVVDLDHLSSRTVVLAHPPRSVLTLSAGDDAELRALIVDHGEPFGLLTVIPDPLADRAETTGVLSGFLLGGLLDERY